MNIDSQNEIPVHSERLKTSFSSNPHLGRSRISEIYPFSSTSEFASIFSKSIKDYSKEQHQLVERIGKANSLRGLLNTIFGEQTDISLIDIGTGGGEFPLALAKIKKDLGINNIVATDINLAYLQKNRQMLQDSGVELRYMDVNNYHDTGERFNIVTLNAPIMGGKNAYFDNALKVSQEITTRPGIMIWRQAAHSIDLAFDPFRIIPKNIPLYDFNNFPDLPTSDLTENKHIFISAYLPTPGATA